MLDAPEIRRARAPYRADHLVALREQQLGEVGSVLPGNSGDNGPFGHRRRSDFSMSADELDRLDREQRDADARYNDALTALDRAIVSMNGRAPSQEDAAHIGTALLSF